MEGPSLKAGGLIRRLLFFLLEPLWSAQTTKRLLLTKNAKILVKIHEFETGQKNR